MKIKKVYNIQPYAGDVGIEVEVEGKNIPPVPYGWKGVGDGSLQGECIEFVTTSKLTSLQISKAITRLKNAFKNNKGVINRSVRAGVHVHINVQDMTHTQVVTFATLYYILEDLLVQWCGETRVGNLFCLRTRDAQGLHPYLKTAIDAHSFESLYTDQIRYGALNWKPITKLGSLEFRALSTPPNLSKVAVWAKMLLQLRTASLKYKHPQDIIGEFSLSTREDFIKDHLGFYANRFLTKDLDVVLNECMYNAKDVDYLTNWDVFEKEVVKKYKEKKKRLKLQKDRYKVLYNNVVGVDIPGEQPILDEEVVNEPPQPVEWKAHQIEEDVE